MKPHEQTWTYHSEWAGADEQHLWCVTPDGGRTAVSELYDRDESVAKLIAAAPEMARLLLEVLDFPGAKHELGMWSEVSPRIRAALRKAGVLP